MSVSILNVGLTLKHNQHQLVTALLGVFCPTKFHLSQSDKELLQREDREASQQEILRGLAKDLPIYTRTNSGGADRTQN